MQRGTLGSHKFVREAEAIELVLFSTPGKGKSHVNRNIEISLYDKEVIAKTYSGKSLI